MNSYTQLYEFASSAGAFEGYVYHREEVDETALLVWVENLVTAYGLLTAEVRGEIQPFCDKTLGRALRSLLPLLGEGHAVIGRLKSMVAGPLPESPDDFQKVKWYQKSSSRAETQ